MSSNLWGAAVMSLLGHTDLTLYEGGGDVPLGTHIDLTLYEGGGDVTLGTHIDLNG